MKNWKQGLSSLLAVAMLGAACPAVFAAEVPTNLAETDVIAAIQTGSASNAVVPVTGTPAAPAAAATPAALGVGSQVMIRYGARSYSGDALAAYAYNTVYVITRFDSAPNAVYIARGGVERARMNLADLMPVGSASAPAWTGPDISNVPNINDYYLEGAEPLYFSVGNGINVEQYRPVMIRVGALSYLGNPLTITNYTTVYSLNRVSGNHAFLALDGREVVDVNSRDIVPIWYDELVLAQNVTINLITKQDLDLAPVTLTYNTGDAFSPKVYTLLDWSQDSSYFIRIRDLALLLADTNAEFEVGITNQLVNLNHGWEYTMNFTEWQTHWNEGLNGRGRRIATNFIVDGQPFQMDGLYVVDFQHFGWSYYRLSDLARLLGLQVTESRATNTITIRTVSGNVTNPLISPNDPLLVP